MWKLIKLVFLVVIIVWFYNNFINKSEPPVDSDPGQTITFKTNLNLTERQYNVYLPSTYNSNRYYPAVFVFHGGGSNNVNIAKSTNFNDQAEKNNFIVIYPQGTLTEKSTEESVQAVWNGGKDAGGDAYKNSVDDIAFVRKIIQEISTRYKIDPARIYSTGISMGGMLSYRLACEMSDVFAAVAPVASTLAIDKNTCNPNRAIPIMHIHGTADKIIPYLGGNSDPLVPKVFIIGGPYLSVSESIDWFKQINNSAVAGSVVKNTSDTKCVLYHGQADVELCTVDGGGHNWPGNKDNYNLLLRYVLGKTGDFPATEEISRFFQEHPKY